MPFSQNDGHKYQTIVRDVNRLYLGYVFKAFKPQTEYKGTMNHLAHEKSPYLLQHKNNPVDWFPWGQEVFGKAQKENKPIFLSIGYSTCHWYHVMEHESFEDAEVASLLNQFFINIKVDREERPDIDHVYMSVCQAMTGTGGWPLTVLMTPDQKLFFAGTYFPKVGRHGRTGLMELLPRIHHLWITQGAEVEKSAKGIVEFLKKEKLETKDINESTLLSSMTHLKEHYDSEFPGFGEAPKFPTPHNLLFLMRSAQRFKDPQVMEMVMSTLKSMRSGGIYDQVGNGFHRYSVDREWKVPHFEKMLYDQALLAYAYTEAYQISKEQIFSQTVHDIFKYVLRDLLAPEGAFYSAEDADSEGEEGKFYVWSYEELTSILNKEELEDLKPLFSLSPNGNFIDMGEPSPYNIFHTQNIEHASASWKGIKQKLFEKRLQRVRPHRDEKILTDWNGLMIAALAKAAQSCEANAETYLQAAEKAYAFIIKNMFQDGSILHRYCQKEAAIEGFADDYAALLWASLELYWATFDSKYIAEAQRWSQLLIEKFWDQKSGGFFFTPKDGEALITRKKEVYDGATPSANGLALWNLARLAKLTANDDLEKKSSEIAKSFSSVIHEFPVAHNMSLIGLDFLLGPTTELVVVTPTATSMSRKELRLFTEKFQPHHIPRQTTAGDLNSSENTFLKNLKSLDGKTTYYVCQNYQCKAPTTDIGELQKQGFI